MSPYLKQTNFPSLSLTILRPFTFSHRLTIDDKKALNVWLIENARIPKFEDENVT